MINEKFKATTNTILALFMAVSGSGNILICSLDYKFKPVSYIAFAIVFIAIFITFAVFAIKFRKVQTTASRIVGMLMPLITIAYMVTFFRAIQFKAPYYPMDGGYFSVLIIVPPAAALTILLTSVRTPFGIVISGILAVLFALYIPSLIFISFMASIGSKEITSSAISPDGRYVAQNIMNDQGAMGGDSYIEIREASKDKFVLVGTFMKNRRTVVTETEFYTSPVLEWVDNETLMVDGVAYSID